MADLESVPDEVLRLVQSFLIPSRDEPYCVMRDRAAPLRCACRFARAALQPVVRSELREANGCVSLHTLLGGQYDKVCELTSLYDKTNKSGRWSDPSRVCALHDCCDKFINCYVREEIMDALRVVGRRILSHGAPVWYEFTSWTHLARFQELTRRAKINMCLKYRPVVTRRNKSLRVTWMRDRRPHYYLPASTH